MSAVRKHRLTVADYDGDEVVVEQAEVGEFNDDIVLTLVMRDTNTVLLNADDISSMIEFLRDFVDG